MAYDMQRLLDEAKTCLAKPKKANTLNRYGNRKLAGAPGFEPGNVGTKNRCLTTWRHPNWRGSYTF
jgi:hypothetical protein